MISDPRKYADFFHTITDFPAYDFQKRLGTEPWPDILDIPTGLGKTAAVVVAWLWKRLHRDADTPRRLVYCLPMRVLVEQTQVNVQTWLAKAAPTFGQKNLEPPAVCLLMGGEVEDNWALYPEKNAIIIGTQDMLLSRALNRGYAAGRARWPIDFALFNNDCQWVFDEVQLMSTGLASSMQLQAWRWSLCLKGEDGFPIEENEPVCRPCRSLWMSATMARHWLDSAVDWSSYAKRAWETRHRLTEADYKDEKVEKLFAINKVLSSEPVAELKKPRTKDNKVDKADARAKADEYLKKLAQAITRYHARDNLTLAIVNTVDRAVALYAELRDKLDVEIFLIHSRFRPMERKGWEEIFKKNGPRLIISTQVVEAGVDMSASVLFTELAPWASLVQRFGRCARYPGENGTVYTVYWMDIAAHESTAAPYATQELTQAKARLLKLGNVGLQHLKQIKDELDQPENSQKAKEIFPYEPRFVPRAKDLFDLFDTTPDLTGADVDVSRFIRDDAELDVQAFWRDIDSAQLPAKKDRPDRRELCPVPFYRFQEQFGDLRGKARVWRWNYRTGWELFLPRPH